MYRWLLCLLLLLLSPQFSKGAPQKLIVEGNSYLGRSTLELSRELAVQDARRVALGKLNIPLAPLKFLSYPDEQRQWIAERFSSRLFTEEEIIEIGFT